jgi:hypothetical protein
VLYILEKLKELVKNSLTDKEFKAKIENYLNDEKNSKLRMWMKSDRLPNFDWTQEKQDSTQDEETLSKSLIWNPNNLVVEKKTIQISNPRINTR